MFGYGSHFTDINNQCFHNISASFFFKYPTCIICTVLFTIHIDQEPNSDGVKVKQVMYYDPSVKIETPEFTCCSFSWLCIGTFCHFSSHSVPHKTVQKVCLILWILEVACSGRFLNHFRDSIRREPKVYVTIHKIPSCSMVFLSYVVYCLHFTYVLL